MIVLASGSPRRRELLGLLFADFQVSVPQVDEMVPPGLAPVEAVQEIALRKARKVAEASPQSTVIGADTAVVLNGQMLGKPRDENHAREMLLGLSGREHQVYTGVAVLTPEHRWVFAGETHVRFSPMSGEQIDWYIATGEPMDKAGAYGIQGRGGLFVEEIRGDYYNVVGLPINPLRQVLENLAAMGDKL